MKLLSIDISTLTILGFTSRTANQIYLPLLLRNFLDRYHFLKYPENLLATSSKYEFAHGIFGDGAIDTLEVYQDGFVVGSKSNTEFLDAFAEDLLDFLSDQWDISLVKSNSVDRMYQSALVIETEKDILRPLQSADRLADAVQKSLSMTTGLDVEFSPFGFSLSADQAKISTMRPPVFKIERRIGIEYQFNQYFTAAPLRTKDHLALLEDWEQAV